MRKYLATLHTKPDHHKKRFAFLASATITLFIFAVWSLVNFGTKSEVVAEETRETEVSPLESFSASIASSFQAIRDSFMELKGGVNINQDTIEGGYKELRNGALDTYGQ